MNNYDWREQKAYGDITETYSRLSILLTYLQAT